MSTRLSNDEFIMRCKSVDGGRYLYDNTTYVDATTRVPVICKVHGEFTAGPANLMRGGGCKQCHKDKLRELHSSTTDIFISKARNVHGDRYDYSRAGYINSITKVEIVCPEHGSFLVTPNDHIHAKSGCRRCSGNYVTSTEEFIQRAIEVHGDRYDYSLVQYNTKNKHVIVICPVHGAYNQDRLHHLRGGGCQKCGYDKQIDTKIKKGLVTDPKDSEPFDNYRCEVRRLSNENYIKYYHDINPDNLPRNNRYNLDHIISIASGFLQGISPEVIASPENLRVIPAVDNQRKGVMSCNAVSSFDGDNIITKPLDLAAKQHIRLKRSNKYRVTDIETGLVTDINSISDWCSARGYSASSARWMASYSTAPFKGRYLIKKL